MRTSADDRIRDEVRPHPRCLPNHLLPSKMVTMSGIDETMAICDEEDRLSEIRKQEAQMELIRQTCQIQYEADFRRRNV